MLASVSASCFSGDVTFIDTDNMDVLWISYVFKKFKDNEYNFNKVIVEDVRGMLYLYEASFLSVHREDIIDEDLSFIKQNLEDASAKYL